MRKDRIAKAFALFMTLVIAGTTGCGGRKTGLNETGNKNVSTQKTSDIQIFIIIQHRISDVKRNILISDKKIDRVKTLKYNEHKQGGLR